MEGGGGRGLGEQTERNRHRCSKRDLSLQGASERDIFTCQGDVWKARRAAGMKGAWWRCQGESSRSTARAWEAEGEHAKVKGCQAAGLGDTPCISTSQFLGSHQIQTNSKYLIRQQHSQRASLFVQGSIFSNFKLGSYFRLFQNPSSCKAPGEMQSRFFFPPKVMNDFIITRIYYLQFDRMLLTSCKIDGCDFSRTL